MEGLWEGAEPRPSVPPRLLAVAAAAGAERGPARSARRSGVPRARQVRGAPTFQRLLLRRTGPGRAESVPALLGALAWGKPRLPHKDRGCKARLPERAGRPPVFLFFASLGPFFFFFSRLGLYPENRRPIQGSISCGPPPHAASRSSRAGTPGPCVLALVSTASASLPPRSSGTRAGAVAN